MKNAPKNASPSVAMASQSRRSGQRTFIKRHAGSKPRKPIPRRKAASATGSAPETGDRRRRSAERARQERNQNADPLAQAQPHGTVAALMIELPVKDKDRLNMFKHLLHTNHAMWRQMSARGGMWQQQFEITWQSTRPEIPETEAC